MKKPTILLLAATSLLLAACSTTRSTQKALVGTWETAPYPPGTTNRATYHFFADGTYSHKELAIPVASQGRETEGSYSVEPGNLLVLTGGVRGLTAQQFFFKDGNLHLVVSTMDGDVVAIYRRGGSQ
jgi:hypothetical protein